MRGAHPRQNGDPGTLEPWAEDGVGRVPPVPGRATVSLIPKAEGLTADRRAELEDSPNRRRCASASAPLCAKLPATPSRPLLLRRREYVFAKLSSAGKRCRTCPRAIATAWRDPRGRVKVATFVKSGHRTGASAGPGKFRTRLQGLGCCQKKRGAPLPGAVQTKTPAEAGVRDSSIAVVTG